MFLFGFADSIKFILGHEYTEKFNGYKSDRINEDHRLFTEQIKKESNIESITGIRRCAEHNIKEMSVIYESREAQRARLLADTDLLLVYGHYPLSGFPRLVYGNCKNKREFIDIEEIVSNSGIKFRKTSFMESL